MSESEIKRKKNRPKLKALNGDGGKGGGGGSNRFDQIRKLNNCWNKVMINVTSSSCVWGGSASRLMSPTSFYWPLNSSISSRTHYRGQWSFSLEFPRNIPMLCCKNIFQGAAFFMFSWGEKKGPRSITEPRFVDFGQGRLSRINWKNKMERITR